MRYKEYHTSQWHSRLSFLLSSFLSTINRYFTTNMDAIGIDMSKRSFHVAFTHAEVREFRNTQEGVAEFLTELQAHQHTQSTTLLGVEATGAYHLLLCSQVTKQGWRIVVINPLESSRVIQAQSLRRVKTDTTDARAIRKAVLLGLGYLFTDTDAVLALKALVVEREGLVRLRSTLKQQREAHTAKQAATTVLLHDSTTPILVALKKEIKTIEILFAAYERETQTLLRSIPGVGVLTAAALVAFVGDITRFASPEKLVAYIGLDPRVHQSGTSVHGKGYISKRGNAYLRHTLFTAAFIARQYNTELGVYYQKKLDAGKHYFSAQCAVERKLIHLIWAVWTRGTPYVVRS
jgi:transposase